MQCPASEGRIRDWGHVAVHCALQFPSGCLQVLTCGGLVGETLLAECGDYQTLLLFSFLSLSLELLLSLLYLLYLSLKMPSLFLLGHLLLLDFLLLPL